MTAINQDKFVKFLGKGEHAISRERAKAIIAEMADPDIAWNTLEDLAHRTPKGIKGLLSVSTQEAEKLHEVAGGLLPATSSSQSVKEPVEKHISVAMDLPGTIRCATCNNILLPGTEYCSHCSTAVAANLVCPECGRQGGVGDKFCHNDGTALLPATDVLCIQQLMQDKNMSIDEALTKFNEMDQVNRGKLQTKALQLKGGRLRGDNCFPVY